MSKLTTGDLEAIEKVLTFVQLLLARGVTPGDLLRVLALAKNGLEVVELRSDLDVALRQLEQLRSLVQEEVGKTPCDCTRAPCWHDRARKVLWP